MKITIINGGMRKGSTWHCADLILRALGRHGAPEVTEFFLPRDMPHFCAGCFSCILRGEHLCPHAAFVKPIADAAARADLLILTSPVYGMDVSGQMKALLDHLCYMWMSHRPNPELFDTVGLTVATASGAGLRHTTKTLRTSLTHWGAKRIYSFKTPVMASSWEDVSAKNKAKIEKAAARLAARVAKAVNSAHRLPNPLFRSLFFPIMALMQKKNDWNPTDRAYWQAHGWLDGKRPY